MSATERLVAVWDGERDSKASWQAVLRDLERRGLTTCPELAIGDGALGFLAALEEEYSETKEPRCWVNRASNSLRKTDQAKSASNVEITFWGGAGDGTRPLSADLEYRSSDADGDGDGHTSLGGLLPTDVAVRIGQLGAKAWRKRVYDTRYCSLSNIKPRALA